MKPRKPIFYDEQRRRWRRTSRILELCGAVFTLFLAIFFVSVLISPSLPAPLLPSSRNVLHPVLTKISRKNTALKRPGRGNRVQAIGQAPVGYEPLRAAFYVSWDPSSLA